jgi:hypothetical protein
MAKQFQRRRFFRNRPIMTSLSHSSSNSDCEKEVKLQVAMAVTLMVGLMQVSG